MNAPIDAASLAAAWGFKPDGKGGFTGFCPIHIGKTGKPNARIWQGDSGAAAIKCWKGCAGRDLFAKARQDLNGAEQAARRLNKPSQSNNQQATRGACRICGARQELDRWLQCESRRACDMRFRATPAGIALADELAAARQRKAG